MDWCVRLLCLAIVLVTSAARAACGPEASVAQKDVKVEGPSVMIAVHPSSFFDARFASKRGIDEATAYARMTRTPLIALADESDPARYFIEPCAPRQWVRSDGGEIAFSVDVNDAIFMGGHIEICLGRATNDVLLQWAKAPPRPRRTMTFLMDAIYSNGHAVGPEDAYYARFLDFLGIVTYGRPSGEHWPKVSLLETLGAIGERNEVAYLERLLPRWDRTLPAHYRVELDVHGHPPKILRRGEGWRPPTVVFRFLESAEMLFGDRFDSGGIDRIASAAAP